MNTLPSVSQNHLQCPTFSLSLRPRDAPLLHLALLFLARCTGQLPSIITQMCHFTNPSARKTFQQNTLKDAEVKIDYNRKHVWHCDGDLS